MSGACGPSSAKTTAGNASANRQYDETHSTSDADSLVGLNEEQEMSHVIHVSQQHFEKAVLQSEIPVVVDFYANWCPPCRQLSPLLDTLSLDFEGKVRFVKINSDEEPALSSQYGVTGLPTLIFFEGGEIVGKLAGLPDESEFRSELQKWIDGIEVSK